MTHLVICESNSGAYEVRIEGESAWHNQEQIATLFGRDRSVINRYLRNIFLRASFRKKAICKICILLFQINQLSFIT